jgi:serine/threonine-protein kinase SRPK3
MNGADIKKAAINKAKQVAHAANGTGGKKRRKADLKPIITTSDAHPHDDAEGAFHYKCVQSIGPAAARARSGHRALPSMCRLNFC